jgi:hypothetical protein
MPIVLPVGGTSSVVSEFPVAAAEAGTTFAPSASAPTGMAGPVMRVAATQAAARPARDPVSLPPRAPIAAGYQAMSPTLPARGSAPVAQRIPESPQVAERPAASASPSAATLSIGRRVDLPLATAAGDVQRQSQPLPAGVDGTGAIMRVETAATADASAGGGGGGEAAAAEAPDIEKLKSEILSALRTQLRVERERTHGWI